MMLEAVLTWLLTTTEENILNMVLSDAGEWTTAAAAGSLGAAQSVGRIRAELCVGRLPYSRSWPGRHQECLWHYKPH